MKGTIDPFYNESFSFKVQSEELEDISLVFTGWYTQSPSLILTNRVITLLHINGQDATVGSLCNEVTDDMKVNCVLDSGIEDCYAKTQVG